MPRPVRLGRLAVARMAAHIVGGERIGLAAAPARRLAGEALQNAADAIMAGRIVGAGVNVTGDGSRCGADRRRGSACATVSGSAAPPSATRSAR